MRIENWIEGIDVIAVNGSRMPLLFDILKTKTIPEIAQIIADASQNLPIVEKPPTEAANTPFHGSPAGLITYLNLLLTRAEHGDQLTDEQTSAAQVLIEQDRILQIEVSCDAALQQAAGFTEAYLRLQTYAVQKEFNRLSGEDESWMLFLLRREQELDKLLAGAGFLRHLRERIERLRLSMQISAQTPIGSLERAFKTRITVRDLPNNFSEDYEPGSPTAILKNHRDVLVRKRKALDQKIKIRQWRISCLRRFLDKMDSGDYALLYMLSINIV